MSRQATEAESNGLGFPIRAKAGSGCGMPCDFRDDLCRLVREIQSIDVQLGEEASGDGLREIARSIVSAAEHATAIIDRVAASLKPPTPQVDDTLRFYKAMDQLVDSDAKSREALDDIIQITRSLYRMKIDQIEEINFRHVVSDAKRLNIVDLLGSCQSQIVKSLIAIENLYSESLSQPPRLSYRTETQRVVEARCVFARLRWLIRETMESRRDTGTAMRSIGNAIGRAIGMRAFNCLRSSDRLQLLSLQQRFLDWFKIGGNPNQAQVIIKDLEFSIELLLEMNRREEVIKHDHETLRKVLAMGHENGERIRKHAILLAGRSLELDRLIFSHEQRSDTWLEVLAELDEMSGIRSGPAEHFA